MEIKICQNKEEWEEYRKNHTSTGSVQVEFLQSWEWGEFQKSIGNKTVRLIADDERMQGFEHKLPGLGKYLYLPRFQISDFRFQNVIDELKKQNYIFLRIEPLIQLSPISYLLSPTKNRQPQQTLVLDLNKTEAELLSAMHPKTRYNIHLAERKGVIVKQEKNIDVFWELNKKTIARVKFKSHEKKYYEEMLEIGICHQLTAYFENRPIASNILIIFNNTATYLHGASDEQYKNLMAPYLLQWEGIKLAKAKNCQYYDFWGVALLGKTACPVEANEVSLVRGPCFENSGFHQCFNNFCWDKNHSWSGVTRFKVGFGGEYHEYLQACDIILEPWRYWLYRLMRRLNINLKFLI